jgi:phospholipid-binding lipoprotein MlaA
MGIGNGCYIVWPVFGASTVRDTFGLGGDWLLTPTSYIDDTLVEVGVDTLDTVNRTSFKLGDYEALKSAAIDPYVSLRNAYIQYREKRIADDERSK